MAIPNKASQNDGPVGLSMGFWRSVDEDFIRVHLVVVVAVGNGGEKAETIVVGTRIGTKTKPTASSHRTAADMAEMVSGVGSFYF